MSKSASLEVTEVVVFKPTVKMNEYLNAALRLMSDSPSKIEKHCDVNRKSWYFWQNVEGFNDWFYAEYAKKRRQIIPKLDAIGLKAAKAGDFDFWLAMNKKVGELSEDPRASNVSVQVNNLLETQRGKYKLDD